MVALREAEREKARTKARNIKNRGSNRALPVAERCNSPLRSKKGKCTLRAGFGTDHVGIGKCKYHGGTSPTHRLSAAKKELQGIMGRPIEINAVDALMWCIRITAGEVEWLGQQIGDQVNKANIIEMDDFGQRKLNVWVRSRQEAMDRLVSYSARAIQLGLAERQVRLAEQYGEMLARLIKGILGGIELTDAQKAQANVVVRRELAALAAPKNEAA